MIVDNITKIALSEPKLNAYMAKFNIFKNRKIIFPHEETIEENHILLFYSFKSLFAMYSSNVIMNLAGLPAQTSL